MGEGYDRIGLCSFLMSNCMYSCFVQFSTEKGTTTYLNPMGMRVIASKTTMERIEM